MADSDTFCFEDDNDFSKDMIARICKEMGIVPEQADRVIVGVRYKQI